MKFISQTLDMKKCSKKEDKENQTFYSTIKDLLPKPNPILSQQLQLSKVNSILPIKSIYLETNEQEKLCQASTYILQSEPEVKQQQSLTLQEFVKPFKLIYQKYQPQRNSKLFATLLYQNGQVVDQPQYIQLDEQIQFDSMFESGNLFQVYKVQFNFNQKSDREYFLILQNDINTKGYNQWFYFSIINKKSSMSSIKLNIININKDMIFYRQGMKILINECNHWRKDSLGLQFYKNNLQRNDRFYYTLSFNYTFIEQGSVYFASNFPYTYSNLQQYIKSKQHHIEKIMTVRVIAKSQAENDVQVITITNNNEEEKQGLFFIGRQHPGETPSSFVIEGLINTLLSFESEELRNKYVIKIIPMLNVDGVIHGNQRCCLKGYDLNRKWGNGQDPLLSSVEEYITKFHKNFPIQLILDIHGHSKKLSAFFYGHNSNTFINDVCFNDNRFSFENSRFMKNTKYLQHTARISLQKLLNMEDNIYTLEISYFGYQDQNKIQDFSINDFREMGRSIVISFQNQIKQKIEITNDSLTFSDQTSQISFSDSQISDDEINLEEINMHFLEPQKQQHSNFDQLCRRSNSIKQRYLKSSQSRNGRAKSQSIQNTIKYQHFTYNFIDNVNKSSIDNFENGCIFLPLQKPKQSEYSIQPLVVMPQHSLKHQFVWQSKIKQGRQLNQRDIKEQRDLKIYQEFKDYVNNKQPVSKMQPISKYSFNDTDLFKKVQTRKTLQIINQ